jgi:hypothetical protein
MAQPISPLRQRMIDDMTIRNMISIAGLADRGFVQKGFCDGARKSSAEWSAPSAPSQKPNYCTKPLRGNERVHGVRDFGYQPSINLAVVLVSHLPICRLWLAPSENAWICRCRRTSTPAEAGRGRHQ